MADHIATRKSTFTSASTSRKRRTHQPSVRTFGRRVSVYSKPEKSKLMAKQKQAENETHFCLQNGPIISQHHRLPCYGGRIR